MNAFSNPMGETRIDAVDAIALPLHVAIFLESGTVVSDETFRLVGWSGSESVSEPFEFRLDLRANTSAKGRRFQVEQLIGRPVTFAVALPAPDATPRTAIEDSARRFREAIAGGSTDGLSLWNGIAASFAMGAPGSYQLVVRPALHLLTLANRYFIYREKTVAGAIAAVLGLHRIVPDLSAVGGIAVARTQDWFQAGESDLDFLRRLMGKAHLYFYFVHGPRAHRMVFANRPDYPEILPGRALRYTYTGTDELGLQQFDVIGDYHYQESLSITGVRSVFARQDEAWYVDGIAGVHAFDVPVPADQAGPEVFEQHKVYQYGMGVSEAQEFNQKTLDSSRAASSQLSGESFCALFRAGHRFRMTEEVMADSNPMPVAPNLDNQRFVLTQVEHEASADGGYHNRFEATDAGCLIAPFSIADTAQGSVLATVVPGYPDSWKYYEKTNFAPAVRSDTDSESPDQPALAAQGVYVRLATDPDGAAPWWVKLAAHMQTAPEVGAQVLVSRANDESELPEVQQLVSAAGSKVVTPSKWTSSTHVGSSYSTRYGDGTSIGFGATSNADLKRAIQIVTRAYDSGRFRDSGYSQGARYDFSTSEATATSSSQDLPATYGPYGPAGDTLNVSETFGSSFSRTVGQVSSGISTHDVSYSKSTIGKTENYSTVTGTSYSEYTHGGDITNITTINANSYSTTTQTGDTTDTRNHTGNATNTTTQVGDTTSTTTQTGTVTTTSTNIGDVISTNTHVGSVINTTTIAVASVNTSTITSQHNTTTVGSSTSVDTYGSQSNTSTVGSQTSMSTVGTQTSMAMTGVHASMSMTGVSANMNLVGVSTDLNLIGAGLRLTAAAAMLDINITLLSIEMPVGFRIII